MKSLFFASFLFLLAKYFERNIRKFLVADEISIAKIANDGIGFMKGYKNKLKVGEDKVLAQWIIQNAEKGWE